MKFRLIFAWYDLWVGVYIDRRIDQIPNDRTRIYIFPIPCVGLVIDLPEPRT